MTKEESLSFLQSCIDKVNLATTEDIQFYKEIYNKNCTIEEQEPNYKSFCEFVAKTIMEEDFELNAGANAEIFCRKLAELGIVRAEGDSWVLESEVEE